MTLEDDVGDDATKEGLAVGKVVSDISMSVDEFIAGPNAGVEHPLGEGGNRLHEWVYDLAAFREPHGLEGGKTNQDSEVLAESSRASGAVVMGRLMFDSGEDPWGDEPPFHMPVFVLTHRARETLVKEGGTTFSFVTDGIESALEQAGAAAGDKDVAIAGGANTIQQFVKAGVLDEIQIHVAPVLLGEGTRLFENLGRDHIELDKLRLIDSPEVTHLKYRVVK